MLRKRSKQIAELGATFKVHDNGLIDPSEAPVFAIRRPDGASEVVLVCEHASNAMPKALGTLGLDQAVLESHIAWDIGAAAVAERLSERLDATLVTQQYSRLVYDCNRPPESADAYPERSEIYDVPGNRGLDQAERSRRAEALYFPFHRAIDSLIDERLAHGRNVALVTVHSFTPVYFGRQRDVEIGILHDSDARLAVAMLDVMGADAGRFRIERNQPYGPEDGVTHTLCEHALPAGLMNVMIEVRNDLVATPADQIIMADFLADRLAAALSGLLAAPKTPGPLKKRGL